MKFKKWLKFCFPHCKSLLVELNYVICLSSLGTKKYSLSTYLRNAFTWYLPSKYNNINKYLDFFKVDNLCVFLQNEFVTIIYIYIYIVTIIYIYVCVCMCVCVSFSCVFRFFPLCSVGVALTLICHLLLCFFFLNRFPSADSLLSPKSQK